MSEDDPLNTPLPGESTAEIPDSAEQERQGLLNRAARIKRIFSEIWHTPEAQPEIPIANEVPVDIFEEDEEVVEDRRGEKESELDWRPAVELLLKGSKADLMHIYLQEKVGLNEETS